MLNHISIRRCFRSVVSWIGSGRVHSFLLHSPNTVVDWVQVRAVWQRRGVMKSTVSCWRSTTVSRVRWAGALSCCNTKGLSEIRRITGNICCFSTTFLAVVVAVNFDPLTARLQQFSAAEFNTATNFQWLGKRQQTLSSNVSLLCVHGRIHVVIPQVDQWSGSRPKHFFIWDEDEVDRGLWELLQQQLRAFQTSEAVCSCCARVLKHFSCRSAWLNDEFLSRWRSLTPFCDSVACPLWVVVGSWTRSTLSSVRVLSGLPYPLTVPILETFWAVYQRFFASNLCLKTLLLTDMQLQYPPIRSCKLFIRIFLSSLTIFMFTNNSDVISDVKLMSGNKSKHEAIWKILQAKSSFKWTLLIIVTKHYLKWLQFVCAVSE